MPLSSIGDLDLLKTVQEEICIEVNKSAKLDEHCKSCLRDQKHWMYLGAMAILLNEGMKGTVQPVHLHIYRPVYIYIYIYIY